MGEPDERWTAFCSWEAYPWKNELREQTERVELHFAEVLDEEFAGAHSPLHMLERALVLAAFSMRRLIEKRLVTDALAASTRPIASYPATSDYRPPFHSSSGGRVLTNYDFGAPTTADMRIWDFANEVIHSSQLLVLNGGGGQPKSGLLIASDWNMRRRVLHIPIDVLRSVADAVLYDTVAQSSDNWNPRDDKIHSARS